MKKVLISVIALILGGAPALAAKLEPVPIGVELPEKYSQEYIDSCWRKINGNDSALAVSGGHIVAELINLLPALPSYNEAGWSQDAIALILQFNKTPQFTTTNRLKTFNITCAVEGVL